MTVFIQGIGAVGGFGSGVAALKESLVNGPPPGSVTTIETPDGAVQAPAFLADTAALNGFIAPRALRRISHYVRMALLGCYLALEDADMLDSRPERMGIIVATGHGSTCNRFDFQTGAHADDDICYSPTQFSNSVHNAAAAYISVFLKEHGPNLSINDFDLSMASALLTARDWIENKRVDAVLAGGVDDFSKAMSLYRHRMLASATENDPSGVPPAIVGEGSVFFLLTGNGGGSRAYGCIQDIVMGNLKTRKIGIPEKAALIVGADGYAPGDKLYSDIIPGHISALTYHDIYGSLPVGMGFDAAIAAISLQAGKLRQSSGRAVNSRFLIPKDQDLGNRSLCCLKVSPADTFGLVTLSAAP